jgi:hypothetical protein
MSLYFVTALSEAEKVIETAKTLVQESDFLEVTDDKFFLKFEGTSLELSSKIGFAEGTTGTGIILLVSAYNGRAPKSVWEWVAQK